VEAAQLARRQRVLPPISAIWTTTSRFKRYFYSLVKKSPYRSSGTGFFAIYELQLRTGNCYRVYRHRK
jgi:hypothetical protein